MPREPSYITKKEFDAHKKEIMQHIKKSLKTAKLQDRKEDKKKFAPKRKVTKK